PGRCRKGPFEVYVTGRYLTVTGHLLPETPSTIEERSEQVASVCARMFAEDEPANPREPNGGRGSPALEQAPPSRPPGALTDEEVIEMAGSARNGDKFKRLWEGDTAGYPSHSEADMALCGILAFWTQDRDQIGRLFRWSKLYRDKWDRADYRQGILDKVLS